jgi:hypothetical protein
MKNPLVLRLGLLCLILASLTRWLLSRAGIGGDLVDGLNGMFTGLAIGLLLLSITLRSEKKVC